jgi:hypothetical protein
MIFKLISILIILVAYFYLPNAQAVDLYAGIGNLSEYIGKVQTDDVGTLSGLTFNPYFKTSIDAKLNQNYFVESEIGLTLPKTNGDAYTHHWSFLLLLNGKYKIDKFSLTLGSGLFFTRISGNGGEETLNNGNGTTSFPLPEKSVLAKNMIVNLSGKYDFYEQFQFELQTFIFNLTNSKSRAFSLATNITYQFGEIF